MHRAKRVILWICCLTIVSGIWITLYSQVSHDRSQALAAAEVNAQNLDRAFEEHVLSTVRQIDTTLQILRSNYLQHPDYFREQLSIYKKTLPENLITQVSVIDPRGVLVFSALPLPRTPVHLGDREHFQAQLDKSKDLLFISKPLLGRVSGKWSIQFSRKIVRPDGSFGGVLVASVTPDYFTSIFRTVDLGENGVVSLVGADRVLRARSATDKYRPDARGETLPAGRPCFDPRRPAAGVYNLPSATDKVQRIWAYRRMQGYPLLVNVGLDQEEVLGPAVTRRNHLIVYGACVSLLLLLATRAIVWLDRQQQVSEASLRESEARFKTLADASFEGIVMSEQGRYVDVNTRMAEILGYHPGELIGQEIASVLPPEERDRVLANLGAGRASHLEHEILRKDGSRRFVETHGRNIVQNGRELRITSIRDITERKQMERALQESEEQFRTLCDAAPIGIIRADGAGNTTYCNPRWEEITGFPAQAGMGRGWLQTVHPDDLGQLLTLATRPIARGEILSHELRQVTPQGRIIWVRLLLSPVYTPEGVLNSQVGTLEDITEILQARQELLKTQKLESLGVLAGGIAHDFNNILTAIFGNISLARFQLDDPEALAKRLEDAEGALVRATDLTKQLLTFSRGGAPVKSIIRLDDLLQEAARFVLHGSNVTCRFELAEDIWPVEADEGQLSQVIHNLMLNAVQAMPEGGTVTIRAEKVGSPHDGGRFVRITLTDTGRGIPEGNLPRIFDPYFTTKPQGNGLGLATCYSIIRKHGGKIRATSKEGEGSSFVLSLPASERPCPSDPKSQETLRRGSGRVLVMDDDQDIRGIAQGMLEELGYTVDFAEHGAQAVALYRQRKEQGIPFLAAILDLTIPGGMGGKETIARLLEIDPGVKAVVSSGYSNDPVMANYLDYGFSAVLSKPYRPQEMGRVLWDLAGS